MDRFVRRADDEIVEAFQWEGDGDLVSRVTVARNGVINEGWDHGGGRRTHALRTPCGWSEVRRGDWIIDGTSRCSAAKFQELYMPCF